MSFARRPRPSCSPRPALVRTRLRQAAQRERALADAIAGLIFVFGRDRTYRAIPVSAPSGELEAETRPGGGTQVRARIPVP
jgi:hypothetical protein